MEHSSFFNSIAGDRKYKASDFSAFFNSLLTNGVFPNPGTNVQVLSNGDMTVSVDIGKAWIDGHVYYNDSALILPIEVADGVMNRIDRIVLRMGTVERSIVATVKKGDFASSPVAPTLQRDADAYEIALAEVYVSAGVVSITQANITDLRMSSLCGWVNSLIQTDTNSIFNQYQAWFSEKTAYYNAQIADMINDAQGDVGSFQNQINELFATAQGDVTSAETGFRNQFNAWFATVQGLLSGDVAGNLAVQITAIPKVYKGTSDPTAPTNLDFWFKEV